MFSKETHILVVDDSVNIRRVIVDNLTRLGFKKIATASEANEGYGKLSFFVDSPTPIQLVLSDLNMPGPSGLDFLKKVRADEKFKELPFLLVTTESEKGAVIEAAVSGVSGYVVKPFNIETLTKRLQDAWNKHYGPGAKPGG
ncbi:MAG: response regulator [Bdellovibrionales bacterium]|nr:response regulator [Bdellovibrionales bacterium]